jgi:uncharacterized RDD family membrane protein YckC
MKKPTLRRVCAYIVDLIVITIISSMFVRIEFLNPKYDEYQKAYDEYIDFAGEVMNNPEKANDTNLNDISYNLSKTGLATNVITLVVTALYFVGFQYINQGQTLGKKLFKIKVVDSNNNRPKFYQILIRALLINSIITNTVSDVLISTLSKSAYIASLQYVQLVDMAIMAASFILIMFREDGKGLHDMIAGTKVVFESEVNKEETKIKEAKVVKTSKKSKNKKEED